MISFGEVKSYLNEEQEEIYKIDFPACRLSRTNGVSSCPF
jgi:hypothetical protein